MKSYEKYLMILLLFLILMLGLGAISASENIDNASIELDEMSIDEVQDEVNEDVICSDNDEIYSQPSSNSLLNGGTFEDIQSLIDNSSSGAVIELSGNFNSTGKSIIINKNLTINGNQNTVLDAKVYHVS